MKTKRRAKIVFTKTKAGGQKGAWRYSVIAANGEILVTSEGYTTKQDAERGYFTLLNASLDLAFAMAESVLKKAPKK